MYSSSMDSTEYSEGDYRLTLAFEIAVQNCSSRVGWLSSAHPTTSPTLLFAASSWRLQ